jgi:hypothetical protein
MQKMNIKDIALEILAPSNLLKVRRNRLIPHAIEMGGAC